MVAESVIFRKTEIPRGTSSGCNFSQNSDGYFISSLARWRFSARYGGSHLGRSPEPVCFVVHAVYTYSIHCWNDFVYKLL